MQLEEIRREYKSSELTETKLKPNPYEQFKIWMEEALSAKINDATAMSLVSIDENGFPQSRIVLLKDFEPEGFTFFTNYNSAKGKAIAQHNKVSLHFYWAELERQVRLSGFAHKTNDSVSKAYFHSRPQASQVAAAVSPQSDEIPSRDFLESAFKQLSVKLDGANPEYPKNWGGYVVKPIQFEFWQGRANRLHDRLVYKQNNENWIISRLAP